MEINQSEKKEKTKQLIYNYPCISSSSSSKNVVGLKNFLPAPNRADVDVVSRRYQ